MRNLLNPRWLWVLNTLPLLLLVLLLGGEYHVIHTLLSPASLALWHWFGAALLGLGLAHAAYAGWRQYRQQPLSAGYALVALGAYLTFLYLYLTQVDQLFPFSVPRWMVSGDAPLYAGTFLMPTLAHAAFILIVRFTPEERPPYAGFSFGAALLVPLSWFVLLHLVAPLWHGPTPEFVRHVVVVLLIASTVAFLFFLGRGVYIIGLRRQGLWTGHQLLWKVLVGLVLPLLGLAVNNGLLFSEFGASGENGVFGNFNSPWFYGLAVLNGALLCLPAPSRPVLRLLLYLGRSATLAFTLYFFLVFLPFLPLSILAVLAIGTGFLMLTPLVLLLVHLRELSTDFDALRRFYAPRPLLVAAVAAAAVLPLALTARNWQHRRVLHQALAYLYTPDYAQTVRIDEVSLASTLAVVKQHKQPDRNTFGGAHLPYLSSYFNWLVLDNLTLSNEKVATIEQVFFGQRRPPVPRGWAARPLPQARLTRLRPRSTYDARQQAWVSWLDLQLTNPAGGDQAAEYAATLELPAGCWVSNYYLDIGPKREYGLLAEKRTATWVFSQIRNEQKDPGLLTYRGGNTLALQVFPFGPGEVRTTGIQLVHKEPVALTLDGQTVQLGQSSGAPAVGAVSSPGGQVTYLSAAAKQALPRVQRRPYYHVIVDVSAAGRHRKAEYARRVARLLYGAPAGARVSLTNAYTQLGQPGDNWPQRLRAQPNRGGFYLADAVRRVLVAAHRRPAPSYPVIVVVTDSLQSAVLPVDFADLQATYPESDRFYVLQSDGRLQPHSLRHRSAEPLTDFAPAADPLVRAWPDAAHPRAYLPDNAGPAVVLAADRVVLPAVLTPKSWQSGLLLQGHWLSQVLHPERTDAEQGPAIRSSFQAGLLTPLTAFLALENEAQKAALRRKQEQVLNGSAALDAGEDLQRMSEPGEWVLLALGGGLYLWQRRRRRAAGPVAG